MGWKGYVQLALRTGQYKSINVVKIHKNQFKSFNTLTEELDADFETEGKGEVVGYVGYLKLLNGFEKTIYWSKTKVINHAKKYSKAYDSSFSPWQDKDQFDAMAMKTVLKNMISKWGIMSIDMETAQLVDQSVQNSEGSFSYVDNMVSLEDKKEKINTNEPIKLP
jgi:recombination protein RecT